MKRDSQNRIADFEQEIRSINLDQSLECNSLPGIH
jgi:hypothetical protein